ncbi:MAG: RdgB/HAM1 family non-canonical purine NTP pyrophosphatase [Candidatus Bipolaricaulota bacterium]
MRVLLGTRNPHKLAELVRILGEIPGIDWHDPRDVPFPEIKETGESLEQNAHLKATQAARATGLPALAEDSGLEVAALQGAPGVHSARYAGESKDHRANTRLLLQELSGVADRRAQFHTVAVLALPDGRTWQAEGVLRGTISKAPRGGGGFGYDPVFVPEGASATLAELSPEEKDRISHRRRALERIRPALRSMGSDLDVG